MGFMLKMPDIAGMIKQPDRFVAYDAIAAGAEEIVVRRSRCVRHCGNQALGIDLDTCLASSGREWTCAPFQGARGLRRRRLRPPAGRVTLASDRGRDLRALVGHRECLRACSRATATAR
ncbi:MAG: hypothetical protein ACLTSX_10605 [Collinsella sp.]